MGVFDDERRAVPDLEERLSGGDLGTFARWATDGEPLGFEELAVPGDLCFVSTGDRVG